MKLFWNDFYVVGLEMISKVKHERNASPTANQIRDFKSQFGVSWHVCADVWNLLNDHNNLGKYTEPHHLLWSLLFLKVYGNEKTHAALVGVTVKTFRKWVWIMIEKLAEMEVIVVRTFLFIIKHCSFSFLYFSNLSIFLRTDPMGKEEVS